MLCNLGGMCRQFIREFCALTAPIIMFDKDDRFVVMRLEQVSRIIPLAAPIPLSQVVGFTIAGLISTCMCSYCPCPSGPRRFHPRKACPDSWQGVVAWLMLSTYLEHK